MALTLQQLLTPSTEAQSLASLLSILDGFGFSATSWQSGSIARNIVQTVARQHSDLTVTIAQLTAGRYNDTATGGWLTLLSSSQWSNDRIPAVAAQNNVLLSDPNGIGPFTITLGQLIAVDPNGHTYRNVTAGTLLVSGTLTLLFEAEVSGKESLPSDLVLSTPLAGVAAGVVSHAPVRLGVDEETDTKLRTRNQAKWSTLAYAGPADAYIAWALSADAHVTRAYVDDLNPRGPGTINLYLAGATGSVDAGVVTNVGNYIQGVTDGIVRRPLSADVLPLSASNATVNIAGTLFVSPSYNRPTILTLVQNALTTMFQALPVGGSGGKVTLAAIYSTAMQVQGVVNVNITAPSTDTTVGATQVPVPSFSLVAVVAG